MSRPSLTDIDSGQEAWDTTINDQWDVIGSAPFPVKEYANEAALPAANLYDRCIVATATPSVLWISDGTTWRPLATLGNGSQTPTRGDVIVGDSTPKWARLALGAANTIFGSDGTDALWRTLTAAIDGAIGSTRGSLLTRAAAAWQLLTPGTSGHALLSNGAGADPAYGRAFHVADADGLGSCMVIRKAFVAGGGGAADDVTIYSATAPFGFRVVDTKVLVSTAVGAATLTLRDATGGAGNALSDALDAGTTGTKRDTALTATRTIAANGTLVLRRSDSGVAGEVVILIERE